jgi:HAD domain in Swiss Army Knife RNA repair proteins
VGDERPILALDVDGVISLFGFEGPLDEAPGTFHLINGVAHCIPENVGERIQRLAEHYEIVWATGWEDRANERLPQILGLAGELPFLTFDGRARFGTAHWKVDAIDEYAADRPLAWIDDCLDDSCHAWAQAREAPTLLVHTEAFSGLTEELTERLIRWVEAGYTGDSVPGRERAEG